MADAGRRRRAAFFLQNGAYTPREWMRFEHLDPDEAVRAHLDLGALRSFGVHWATFQLGDEEPYQPALDLARATLARSVDGFDLVPIGRIVDVPPPSLPASVARPFPDQVHPLSPSAPPVPEPATLASPEESHVHAQRSQSN